MKKTGFRIVNLILSTVIVLTILNLVSPYIVSAFFGGNRTNANGVTTIAFGEQMHLEEGETVTSSDNKKCKIEDKLINIVGVGSFNLNSSTSGEQKFFAWNAKLIKGYYFVYDDENLSGTPTGYIKSICYLAVEPSSNGNAFKILEALGTTSRGVENKYIANYYDSSSGKSRSVYFEYSFAKKESFSNETAPDNPNANTKTNTTTGTKTNSTTGNKTNTTTGSGSSTSTSSNAKLKVHFIDPNSRVDAIYIEFDGKSFFIDGGFPADAKAEIAYLKRKGVKKIDYYIGSHSHKNHVGAAAQIIYTYKIKTIIVNTARSGGQYAVRKAILQHSAKSAWTNYVKKCKWVYVKAGDDLNKKLGLTSSPLKIKCIGPLGYVSAGIGETKQNYNSMVLNFTYKKTSFLFTGDLSSSGALAKIIKKYPSLCKVDVLKNPHHNSKQSKSTYKKFGFKYIVYLTKKGYLPKSSALSEIKSLGAKYYIVTTNKDKSVLMTSNGSKITVKTKN